MNIRQLRYFDFGSTQPIILLISRVFLVTLFLWAGIPKLLAFSGVVGYMVSLNVPFPMLAAIIAVLMEVFASLAILVGFFTRPIALLFVFYTLGTAFIGHAYWTMTGDQVHTNMIGFYKNLSIAGGFLLLVITGAGKIALDEDIKN